MSEINRTTIQEVASLLGEGWYVTEDDNHRLYLVNENQERTLNLALNIPYLFRARYHGSSTVRLEIELPLEKALEVIKVL
jgi:hypothetical protein